MDTERPCDEPGFACDDDSFTGPPSTTPSAPHTASKEEKQRKANPIKILEEEKEDVVELMGLVAVVVEVVHKFLSFWSSWLKRFFWRFHIAKFFQNNTTKK